MMNSWSFSRDTYMEEVTGVRRGKNTAEGMGGDDYGRATEFISRGAKSSCK